MRTKAAKFLLLMILCFFMAACQPLVIALAPFSNGESDADSDKLICTLTGELLCLHPTDQQ